MMSRKALATLLYSLALGAAIIAVAVFSGGQHASRVFAPGVGIIAGGLAAALALAGKGKKADQECDEREDFINEKSMKFTFWVMSFMLAMNWAYDFAVTGSRVSIALLMLVLFWGSFGLAYGFHKLRT